MIPLHVVSGMSGAVMVLPRDGLKDENGKSLRYDRVYYIGESDFYVPRDEKGKFISITDASDYFPKTLEVMHKLIPTHVVFEGKVGALTGKNALQANVGETVLIVHSQANRDSRPHLIGGHGDYVWEEGKFNNPPQKDLETWFIRGGSAGAALYKFRQPGVYAYLSHNLIEAVELGATAHFKVEGKWDDGLMKQVVPPSPIETTPSARQEQPAVSRVNNTPVKGSAQTISPATPKTQKPPQPTLKPARTGAVQNDKVHHTVIPKTTAQTAKGRDDEPSLASTPPQQTGGAPPPSAQIEGANGPFMGLRRAIQALTPERQGNDANAYGQ
jgi:FtsP/CotA-like multicopper oxidase with cupredoxin domain